MRISLAIPSMCQEWPAFSREPSSAPSRFTDPARVIDSELRDAPRMLVGLLGRTPGLRHTDSIFMGDFVDRGTGQFACGGGGFVFSRAALDAMDLKSCIRRYHNGCADEFLSNDVIVARCAADYGVRPVRDFSCGTCGLYDRSFTVSQLRSGSCFFAQMQRSHNPLAYLPYIKVPASMSQSQQKQQQQQPSPPQQQHTLQQLATLDSRVSSMLAAGVRPNVTVTVTNGRTRDANRSSRAALSRPHVRAALSSSSGSAAIAAERGAHRSRTNATTAMGMGGGPAVPLSRWAHEAAAREAFAREAALRRARLTTMMSNHSDADRTRERLQMHDGRRAAMQMLHKAKALERRDAPAIVHSGTATQSSLITPQQGRRLDTSANPHDAPHPTIWPAINGSRAEPGSSPYPGALDPKLVEARGSIASNDGGVAGITPARHRHSRHHQASNATTAVSMPPASPPPPPTPVPRLQAPSGLGPAIIHRLYELVSRDGAGTRPLSRHLWAVVGYDPLSNSPVPGNASNRGSATRLQRISPAGGVPSRQLRRPRDALSQDTYPSALNDTWRPSPADFGRASVDVSIFSFPE